ncbi:MAG: FAD-binding protein [Bifidobacteriaceae bacterium]|nr:FAD-binding protein [Bifidobacteriaceae bacterium]
MSVWVLATDPDQLEPLVAAGRQAGVEVAVVAVGSRELAEAAAVSGADQVRWIQTHDAVPPEAYAPQVAALARGAGAGARVWLAGNAPAARALLGAAAVAAGAALVGGGLSLAFEGGVVVLDRVILAGAVIETLEAAGKLAVIWESSGAGDAVGGAVGGAVGVPIEEVLAAAAPGAGAGGPAPWDMRREATQVAATAAGLADAPRVVGVGRGLRSRADLVVVEELARALGAEIACSMPLADDLHWFPEERYIGRSGQKIAPRVYLALGIAGEPQHMEGVRNAKVVAAVNNDPGATVFRHATYGIVGDLYEVAPALTRALEHN